MIFFCLVRIFPYGITVGALTILFIILILIMIGQNNLDPNAVILGSFILIVLFLAGLIETAIQLFGPAVRSLQILSIHDALLTVQKG